MLTRHYKEHKIKFFHMFQYARKKAAVYPPDNCAYHLITVNGRMNFLHKRQPRFILYCEKVEPRTNSYEVDQ
jgi:citrate lyase synthetase